MTLVLPFAGPFAALASRPLRVDASSAPGGRVAPAGQGADAEAAWIRAARGGDARAFRQLVDRYRGQVVELCVRIVRSHEEGEEAAQDAFVRAWNALPQFRGDAKFSTWLYRIAARRALDAAAARRRRRDREDAREPATLEAVPAADANSGLDESLRRRLWRILGELEPLPRAVVTLFYLGERSVGEVAEILSLPEGTVKTHLHRSRAAIRRAWTLETIREERHGLPRV